MTNETLQEIEAFFCGIPLVKDKEDSDQAV